MTGVQTCALPISPEASKQLIALPIDVRTGQRIEAASSRYSQYPQYSQYGDQQQPAQRFMEYFRLDPNGRMQDSQYKLVSREGSYSGFPGPEEWDQERGLTYRRDYDSGFFGNPSGPPRAPEPRYRQPSSGPFGGGGFPFPFTPPWAQGETQSPPPQMQQPRQRTGERNERAPQPQTRAQRTRPDYLAPSSRF